MNLTFQVVLLFFCVELDIKFWGSWIE